MAYFEPQDEPRPQPPLSVISILVLFTVLGLVIVGLLIAVGALVAKLKSGGGHRYYGIPVVKPKRVVIANASGDANARVVGFFSPGSSIKDHYKNITEYQERLKHEFSTQFKLSVKWSEHSFEKEGYLAGNDTVRASDVNQLFKDQSVQLMIANRGGYGCNRILHLINYEAIKKNPKIFMGYSDVTSCLNAIFFKTGLITFHGVMGLDPFTEHWPGVDYNLNAHYFKKLLIENDGTILFKNPAGGDDNSTIVTIKPGKAKGILVGGNLSVFTAMLGSEYLPPRSPLNIPWEDIILFFEDIGEDPPRMDRMFHTLKYHGVLDKVAGFVFGSCISCEPATGSQSLEWVIRGHVTRCPSFMGSRIGHEGQQFILPIGARVEIDADAGSIQLLEKALSE